jgi:hypothetical protein
MRMTMRSGKDILDHSFRQFPGRLILFLDHPHPGTRFNISPVFSIHEVLLLFLPLIRVGSRFHYGFSVAQVKNQRASIPGGRLYSKKDDAGYSTAATIWRPISLPFKF